LSITVSFPLWSVFDKSAGARQPHSGVVVIAFQSMEEELARQGFLTPGAGQGSVPGLCQQFCFVATQHVFQSYFNRFMTGILRTSSGTICTGTTLPTLHLPLMPPLFLMAKQNANQASARLA
jgi:hypothetical protein